MSGHSHWATIKHKKGAIDAKRGKMFSKLGSAGAVKHLFKRKGYFSIRADGLDEDRVMAAALDANAEDVKLKGANYEITSDPAHFSQVQDALSKAGLTAEVSEITQMADVP